MLARPEGERAADAVVAWVADDLPEVEAHYVHLLLLPRPAWPYLTAQERCGRLERR